MRVVIDTNIMVSGVLSPGFKPGRILDLLLDGQLDAVYSTELMDEYREVLLCPKFGSTLCWSTLLAGVEARAVWCAPRPQDTFRSNDPCDQFVVDLAVQVDAAIATGNTKHFSGYSRTLNAAEFLEALSSL